MPFQSAASGSVPLFPVTPTNSHLVVVGHETPAITEILEASSGSPATGTGSCQMVFYSARQWRSTGIYTELYRPQDVEHELMLTLPVPPGTPPGPGRTVRLFLFRGPGPDFSEADRALLTLLRPHLQQAYLDAERRRHPLPRLTPRHRQLLDLLAAGHTNAQIARRLGLAEGTVRTHLYRRLQVSGRAEAAARAVRDQDPYAGTGWSVEGSGPQKR
jgi:DNA-binding CsgD family transcriptional regulator